MAWIDLPGEGACGPDPAKEPSRDGRLVAPDEGGGTNYRAPSFDPATGLFIVSARDAYAIYFFKEEHGKYGWAGADYGVHARGYIRAMDYQTGKVLLNIMTLDAFLAYYPADIVEHHASTSLEITRATLPTSTRIITLKHAR